MAKSCYPARPELNPLQERPTKVRWKRKSSQSFRAFRDWQAGDSNHLVLYDYELDRAVEISRLAGWVLSELTEYTSTDNIVTRAAARAQLNTQEVEPVVTSAISALDRAGLLAAEALPQICKEGDSAGTGPSGH